MRGLRGVKGLGRVGKGCDGLGRVKGERVKGEGL
jgi:hypothetical protein